MSAKGRFLILRRFRAGDEDLMLKVYGSCGMAKLLVPRGILPQEGYLGYAEPFNLLKLVYRQSGDLLLLKDVVHVEFLSYLSLESYSAYLWMSSVASFVERWFLQYEQELFDMTLNYLTLRPRNSGVFLLRFKLEFLKRMGLYKEEVFGDSLRKIVRGVIGEENPNRLERLRISKEAFSKLEEAIEAYLSASL
ncbi:MAG: hypothetical protein RMH93_01375 [Aquificaceae bacterium]|nr:hypothetical protein [Aquificaceae bacterium]